MEAVVIVGSGGHAKVVIDILEDSGEYAIAGCTSADPRARELMGIPVLGSDAVLEELYAAGLRRAFIALGDNRLRAAKTREVEALGFTLVNAVSVRAAVSKRASLGRGVAVMPGAVINALASVGDGAIVNTGATVDHDCLIGAFAHIGPGVNLCGRVTVGEGVLAGAGARVIPGVSIGAWAKVGAGAAV